MYRPITKFLFPLLVLALLCGPAFAENLGKVNFDTSPVLTVPVAVGIGATSGLSTAATNLRSGATIVGIYATSNQDQLVDKVEIVNVNPVISGVTLADNDPVEVTATAHGLLSGDRCYISGVVGTVELNSNWYSITKVDANTFTLDGTDSADFTAYTSDGLCASEKAQVKVTLAAAATAANAYNVTVFKTKWQ